MLITGAGRGFGAAIATAFAREGAKVVINYRKSEESASKLAQSLGPRAMTVQADVTKHDDVARMFSTVRETFGSPTTVVNNAIADYSFNGDARETIETLSSEAMLAQLETAVLGALNVIQEARTAMAEAGFGRIINIGSNLVQNPVVPYHDYTASKGALLAMTRTAATELGPLGITMNMVSGGLLRTTDASAATPDEVFDMIAANTPLRTVTTPEEAADVVVFFASPWARAVTGQNLIVDGGLVFS